MPDGTLSLLGTQIYLLIRTLLQLTCIVPNTRDIVGMCCYGKRVAIGWAKPIGEGGSTTTGETIEGGVGWVVLRVGGGEGK